MHHVPAFFRAFPIILISKSKVIETSIPFEETRSGCDIRRMNMAIRFCNNRLGKIDCDSPTAIGGCTEHTRLNRVFRLSHTALGSSNIFHDDPEN